MILFCLPLPPNPERAVSKVEQNLKKSEKCSTTGSKFGPATSKVDKISKSNVLTVIEQVMSSTAFGKITAVYGHIDENGRFVRKWTVPKMAITDKMVKNSCLSVKIQVFLIWLYGQMNCTPCQGHRKMFFHKNLDS